jgi:hypothetical protein
MVHTVESFLTELHGRGERALTLQPFRQFVLRVMDELDSSPDSFWKCRYALEDLAKSRGALEYIECQLLDGLDCPNYVPELVVLDCNCFSLHLRFVLPGSAPRVVSGSVEHRMMAMVHGTAQVHRFEQPRPEPVDVFDPARRIVCGGVVQLRVGDVLECRAAVDCSSLSVADSAVMFEMRSRPIYSFQWLYDSITLVPKRLLFVDPQDMRAQLALLTALNLGCAELTPNVRSFLDHPNHFIRWFALKCLAHLEPDKMSAHLEVAVRDRHCQVRAAALEIMQQVNNGGKGAR